MSKVLVIKGADFSVNKMDTITFEDGIPCTGISLNRSTISFTRLNESVTLIPTVTPSDTTDGISWSSSNDSVATVNSHGVVTVQGIGTATITAQCGSYTASCTVTVTVIFNETDLLRINGYGVIANTYAAGNDAAKFVAQTAYYPLVSYGLATGKYEVAVNSSETVGEQVYPIPIPASARTLVVTLPDTTGTKLRNFNISYHNSEELQTSVSEVTACKYIGYHTYAAADFDSSKLTLTIDLTTAKPSGADSMCCYCQTTGASVSVTDPITLSFS